MKKLALIILLLLVSSSVAYASFKDIIVRHNSVTVVVKNITRHSYYCWGRAIGVNNRGNTYYGEWKEVTLLTNQTAYWHVYNNNGETEWFVTGFGYDVTCNRQENYEIND